MNSIVASRPFTLSWAITLPNSEEAIKGSIRFDSVIDPGSFVGDESEDALEDVIRVVECSPHWGKLVIPVLVTEMGLDGSVSCPEYDSATFELDALCVEFLWCIKPISFGNFWFQTARGKPIVTTDRIDKDTMKTILEHIILPS